MFILFHLRVWQKTNKGKTKTVTDAISRKHGKIICFCEIVSHRAYIYKGKELIIN